jgi:hypothetical protein
MNANVKTPPVKDAVYGKYEGTVASNLDPLNIGRVTAFVPKVLGPAVPTTWARPCVPYAGIGSGFFSVPPPGAGVWIEFLGGDVSQPIWTGCYWGAAQTPPTPPAHPPAPNAPTTKIWRSELGLTAALNDLTQTITLSDALGVNQVVISVATGTVTVKGIGRVVLDGAIVQEGSQKAAHPAVLGDQMLAYLNMLVTLFNTHVHPGELALGVLPVTPAPPIMQMPPPTPSLLSRKVLLE